MWFQWISTRPHSSGKTLFTWFVFLCAGWWWWHGVFTPHRMKNTSKIIDGQLHLFKSGNCFLNFFFFDFVSRHVCFDNCQIHVLFNEFCHVLSHVVKLKLKIYLVLKQFINSFLLDFNLIYQLTDDDLLVTFFLLFSLFPNALHALVAKTRNQVQGSENSKYAACKEQNVPNCLTVQSLFSWWCQNITSTFQLLTMIHIHHGQGNNHCKSCCRSTSFWSLCHFNPQLSLWFYLLKLLLSHGFIHVVNHLHHVPQS